MQYHILNTNTEHSQITQHEHIQLTEHIGLYEHISKSFSYYATLKILHQALRLPILADHPISKYMYTQHHYLAMLQS